MVARDSSPQEIYDESQRVLALARALRNHGRALREIAARLGDGRSESEIRHDLERRIEERAPA